MLHTWATIPFHFIWIGVSLRYGWRVWSTEVTAVSLAVIVDASHVLRTPLTIALGHAVLLQRSFGDPDAVGEAQVVDEPSGPPCTTPSRHRSWPSRGLRTFADASQTQVLGSRRVGRTRQVPHEEHHPGVLTHDAESGSQPGALAPVRSQSGRSDAARHRDEWEQG
jgi:hypothetical protein